MESKHKHLFYAVPDYQVRLIKEHIKDPKYKTELCKNYVKYGKCTYKGKCRYAHGEAELISKNLSNKNYKKTKCDKFFTPPGVCPYGFRCQYIHETRSLDSIEYLKESYYTTLLWIKRYSDYSHDNDIYNKDLSRETTLDIVGEVSEKHRTPYNLKSYSKASGKINAKNSKDAESIYEAKSSISPNDPEISQNRMYPKRLQVFVDLDKSQEYLESKPKMVNFYVGKNSMNYSTESVSTSSSYSPYLHYILSGATVENFNFCKAMEYKKLNAVDLNSNYCIRNNDESQSFLESRKQSLAKRSCDSSVTETTKESKESQDFLTSLKFNPCDFQNNEDRILK